MSAKLMGLVFELAIPLKPKMVLLKYADHADPDGCNAWPSVPTVARGCSIPQRTTARIIRTLKNLMILQRDNPGFGGRKERPKGQSYRIDLDIASKIGPETWNKTYEKDNKQERETCATQVADVSDGERMPSEGERMPSEGVTNATQVADKPLTLLEPRGAREADALTRDPSEKQTKNQGASKEARARRMTEAIAFWKQHAAKIEEAVDERAWSAWLDQLVPLRDDGKTLTLACTSAAAKHVVKRDYGDLVGGIVDREIVCEFRAWAAEFLARRDKGRARQGKQGHDRQRDQGAALHQA